MNQIQRIQDIVFRKSETSPMSLDTALTFLDIAGKNLEFFEVGVIMRVFDMIYYGNQIDDFKD